jgi:hypothetical protein
LILVLGGVLKGMARKLKPEFVLKPESGGWCCKLYLEGKLIAEVVTMGNKTDAKKSAVSSAKSRGLLV